MLFRLTLRAAGKASIRQLAAEPTATVYRTIAGEHAISIGTGNYTLAMDDQAARMVAVSLARRLTLPANVPVTDDIRNAPQVLSDFAEQIAAEFPELFNLKHKATK